MHNTSIVTSGYLMLIFMSLNDDIIDIEKLDGILVEKTSYIKLLQGESENAVKILNKYIWKC